MGEENTGLGSYVTKVTGNSAPLLPLYLVGAALVLATFIFDLSVPLGVAGGVPYVAPVLLSLLVHDKRHVIYLALICSILTVVGFFFSPEGGELWKVIANRCLALFAIWVTALLIYRWKIEKDRNNLKFAEMLDDKQDVYLATVHGAQHIVNNLLNQLLLVEMEAKRLPDFDAETLKYFQEMHEESRLLIQHLSSIEHITGDRIRSAFSHQRDEPLKQTAVIAYTIRNSRYLNVTNRCTLRCRFCPKQRDLFQVREYGLGMQRPPSSEEMIEAIGDPLRYDEVVFCGYGEPTLRLKEILSVADWVVSKGGRVRLNTDGLANRVYRRNVLPEMKGRIHAVSVSMNADTKEAYNHHCHPGIDESFDAMLDFLRLAPGYIPEVTATAINGLEGVDIPACRELADELGVKFRERTLGELG